MLREYALKAWEAEQEKQKQSYLKKRKRRAKKIEDEIYDLVPKDVGDLAFHRDLDDATYGTVIGLTEDKQTMRFTFDDNDELTLIGECADCHKEALSKPILSAADLGQMIEAFESGSTHTCQKKGNKGN